MIEDNPFDNEYTEGAPSTAAPKQKSTTKQFLKKPVEQKDLERYGTSKPYRVSVRAKLIHDKG